MKAAIKILTYILAVIAILALGGLAGWYFFLSNKTVTTSATDTARGLGSPAPSFGGTTGSMQANVATGSTIAIVGQSSSQSAVSSSQLWEVSKTPVAGFGFVTNGTSTQSLYYADRAAGYIESADLSTRKITRLTNDLHPKTYQAIFTNIGDVLERSINTSGTVTTFVGGIKTTIATSTASSTLSGLYFPDNILTVAVNPATASVFYLTHTGTATAGGTIGTTAAWDASKKKQVFTSLVGSWRPQYLGDGRIILTESPADDISGYAFQLNSDGSLTDLVRDVSGLTVAPDPSSHAIIYGQSSQGALTLYSQITPTATSTTLSIATIADKCTWFPGKAMIAFCAVPKEITTQTFLNDWYRGVVHTNDTWWEVNTITGAVSQIYSPISSDGVALDVKNPQIDQSGNYIAFINTTDDSLWVLKITK